jgi:NMD protein affecting ribosome stability and mRNA decay
MQFALKNDSLLNSVCNPSMKPKRPIRHQIRGNPFLRERRHDPYRAREKLHEKTTCPECGVIYRNGRWMWPKSDTAAFRTVVCPACRRINDRCPAGELLLRGSFLTRHREEILATIRRLAEFEQSEHPLHRIMDIEIHGNDTVITTTDIHLPHRIAHALEDAWAGSMSMHYDLEGYFARACWERDN